MASNRQYRPHLDWTPDTKLSQRFATWKAEIEDEVLLFEGEDKPSKYICNYVKVCSGERGKAICRELKVDAEVKDYRAILNALETKVKPANEEISASTKYFYLRQGNSTLPDFYKQATDIVEAMNIEDNPKDKTLRNVLLNGLASKEVYTECLKMKSTELTSKKVMEIAANIESRNIMAEDLSDIAKQVLPENAVSGRSSTQSANVYRIRDDQKKKLACGWCGSNKRCRRSECPAKDSFCKSCGRLGHWEKVCRMKDKMKLQHTSRPQSKLHHLNQNDEEEDPEVTEVVEFNTLNTKPDPSAPHLRPIWLKDPFSRSHHVIEAEVDSGAGCNTFPLYLYRRIFKQTTMEPPSVTIRAYGDQPVENLGSKVMELRVGNETIHRRFQICDVRKNPILGRTLSEEIGYITFPPIQQPKIQEKLIHQEICKISTTASDKKPSIKKPTIENENKDLITIDGQHHQVPVTEDHITGEFKDVFNGMGELPGGNYRIQMKANAEPKQHAPRRVPERQKEAYKAELERLVSEGIIAPVDCHTEWVNSVVSVDKPDGTIRLCLDPCDVNKTSNEIHIM